MHIRIILEFFEKNKCPGIAFFPPKFQLCFWWTTIFKNNWTIWWSFTFIYFVSLFLFHNQCFPPYVCFPISPSFFFYVLAQVFGLPWWLSGKETTCNVGNEDSIPWLGISPGEGNGNPLQYSCLENPMDRGAWWATVHGITKNRTRLSN